MAFPVVDMRALGWGFVSRPASSEKKVAAIGRPVPFLGVRASDAVNEAAKNLEKSRAYAQRVHDSYQDLAAAIGEEKATLAYEEAKNGMEQAQKSYDATVEIVGGSQ